MCSSSKNTIYTERMKKHDKVKANKESFFTFILLKLKFN